MSRYHLTIPDRLDEILQSLVEDCNLTPSQIFTQLLARNSADLRSKFGLDCAELQAETQTSERLHTIAQKCTPLHISANTDTQIANTDTLPAQSETDTGLDFASMIANS